MASRDVQVRIGTLDQYLTPQAREAILLRLAMLAIGRIKRRTGQGKDVEGRPFKPYSARYAAQRKASGRTASPPTLLLSGAMLGSMKVLRSSDREAVIGFEGTSAAARFTKRARPLRFRGELIASAYGPKGRNRYGRGAVKATHAVTSGTARVANALKARWNDQGEGKVPRRHFFGLSQQDRRELDRDGLKAVIEAVRTASFARFTSAGALRRARTGSR